MLQFGFLREAQSVIKFYLANSNNSTLPEHVQVPLPKVIDKSVCVLVDDFRASQQVT